MKSSVLTFGVCAALAACGGLSLAHGGEVTEVAVLAGEPLAVVRGGVLGGHLLGNGKARREARREARSSAAVVVAAGDCVGGACGKSAAALTVTATEAPAVIRTETIYKTQKVGQKTTIAPATANNAASQPGGKAATRPGN